jgi:GNAT superfamily N-acetyltransferase
VAKPQITVIEADSPALLDATRTIFTEYANSTGVDLCFQNFDAELAGLPGSYTPPSGALLLAFVDGQLAGCGALHALADADYANACEMKRLYVRRAFRGFGLGRRQRPAIRCCCSTRSTTWKPRATSTNHSVSSRSRRTTTTRSPALTT